MEKIIVKLDKQVYPIMITHGVLNDSLFDWPLSNGDQVVCITDNHIAPIYLNGLHCTLTKLGVIADQLILPEGECSKSLVSLDTIFTKLISQNYDRNTILLAFGGGVIGDITGFAAATYQRGIRFIQVPTTLLAQVDASIGGKTGINHILGKNMIGAFHQPIAVIIDLDYLKTLSVSELSSGLAEVIKYAIAFDSIFFNWLENHLDDIVNLHLQSLMYCVRRCCELKVGVVKIDEYDRGIRNLLNLGHTYGHAIESYLGYTPQWSHGAAIAVGIMMAASTALRLGKLEYVDVQRIKSLLIRANLPVHGPEDMDPKDYVKYMIRDKKSTLGQLNLILPVSIGNVKSFFNVEYELILESIKDSFNL